MIAATTLARSGGSESVSGEPEALIENCSFVNLVVSKFFNENARKNCQMLQNEQGREGVGHILIVNCSPWTGALTRLHMLLLTSAPESNL